LIRHDVTTKSLVIGRVIKKEEENTLKRKTLKNIICGTQEVKDISQRHINSIEEVLN
jgi:hypothetical protein